MILCTVVEGLEGDGYAIDLQHYAFAALQVVAAFALLQHCAVAAFQLMQQLCAFAASHLATELRFAASLQFAAAFRFVCYRSRSSLLRTLLAVILQRQCTLQQHCTLKHHALKHVLLLLRSRVDFFFCKKICNFRKLHIFIATTPASLPRATSATRWLHPHMLRAPRWCASVYQLSGKFIFNNNNDYL